MTIAELQQKWHAVKQQNRQLHDRELAAEIGVTEAELVAAQVGVHATRLQGPWEKLLLEFHRLGRVMMLTRNDAFVQERHGVFPAAGPNTGIPSPNSGTKHYIGFNGGIGLVLGAIDLRLFMRHWHYGFACEQQRGEQHTRSFRFFDQHGASICKVYLQPTSNIAAFDDLRAKFQHPQQTATLDVSTAAPMPAKSSTLAINQAAFLNAWQALQDTHEFQPLLDRFKLDRLQALRLAEGRFTQRLDKNAPSQSIKLARDHQQEIMLFLNNPGCMQIYSGPIKTISQRENWFNVMDPEFHLHLREDLVAESWLVRKPTSYGEISSIEFFDRHGSNIGLIFACRHDPQVSPVKWERILAQLGASACVS